MLFKHSCFSSSNDRGMMIMVFNSHSDLYRSDIPTHAFFTRYSCSFEFL
jgi:hypothetical protein